MRDLDEFERGLVHRRLELLVAVPVTVGLLDDDISLQQEPLEHLANIKGRVLRVAHTERDVLEVAEKRQIPGRIAHAGISRSNRRQA